LEFKTLPQVSSLKEFIEMHVFNKLKRNKAVRQAPTISIVPKKVKEPDQNYYYDLAHGKTEKFVKRFDIPDVKTTGRTFEILDGFINSQNVRLKVDPDPSSF
jgi:hypothetical protein